MTLLKLKSNNGFSLVELAIVFMVLSLIFIPIVGLVIAQDKKEKQTEDAEGNDRAVAAINYFLKKHGRYPCPADPFIAYDDANFGAEDCSAMPATAPTAATADVYVPGFTSGPVSFAGMLPVKTLNMPFHAAFNEYGWRHIYAVTDRLAWSNAATGNTAYDGTGVIDIVNESNDLIVEDLQFIVVNPGPDGKGSTDLLGNYPSAAVGGDCTSGALDDENCNGDAVFREAEGRDFSDKTDANFYDDALAYTRNLDKNDPWVVQRNLGGEGRIEISNRNMGNIGVGTTGAPAAKFHVDQGNILIEADGGAGGALKAEKTLDVNASITSEAVEVVKTDKSGLFSAAEFCFGQIYNNVVSGTLECCKNDLYVQYAHIDPADPSSDVDGTETCGTLPLACTGSDNAVDIYGVCCSSLDINKTTGVCS